MPRATGIPIRPRTAPRQDQGREQVVKVSELKTLQFKRDGFVVTVAAAVWFVAAQPGEASQQQRFATKVEYSQGEHGALVTVVVRDFPDWRRPQPR
jgi:uncharacterized lipoprotein YmbA